MPYKVNFERLMYTGAPRDRGPRDEHGLVVSDQLQESYVVWKHVSGLHLCRRRLGTNWMEKLHSSTLLRVSFDYCGDADHRSQAISQELCEYSSGCAVNVADSVRYSQMGQGRGSA
jgi:hypothetical protein